MHDYNIEFTEAGKTRTISFCADTPNGALDRAKSIAPGHLAILSDENGEICRLERLSREDVWLVAHPQASK